MISESVQVELTILFLLTAQIIAFAIIKSGVTLMPAKSTEFFSRLTYSMVLVASTSTKMLTCGAVNALFTIAVAIAFLTPLTGIRSSRSVGCAGVVRFLNTDACDAAPTTSSRVISPFRPVPVTVSRFTPSSLASFRIGGFAIPPCELTAACTIETGMAVAIGATFTALLRDLASPVSP